MGARKRKAGPALYFCLLFAVLGVVYGPTFRYPPRSDYWSAFYVFQKADAAGPMGWTEILAFDLWGHGTYRPLSHLVPYLQHRLFSPDFVWNHILNFAFYGLSIVLLYLLAAKLGLDRVVTALFLTVFAFLFSHFDILGWSFQLFSILGFCSFLFGFILYLGWLESGRKGILPIVGGLFIFGMLLSEAYALWPLAVLILPWALPGRVPRRGKATGLLLGAVYLLYLGGFVLHRAAAVTTGELPAPILGQMMAGIFASFFNLLYNGILVNAYPPLALPLYYDDNMNLGGALLKMGSNLEGTAFWSGVGVFVLLGLGFWLLARERKTRALGLLGFVLFLYLANFTTVTVARLTTNLALYPLSQFRYQYVPNALLGLLLAAVFGGLRPGKRGKLVLGLVLAPVLALNIAVSHRQVVYLGQRLAPLGAMLVNIRQEMEEGRISGERPLYIGPGVERLIPSPGWNRSMARFMKGNFQWFFPASEQGKFTLDPDAASWVVTPESFPAIREKATPLSPNSN